MMRNIRREPPVFEDANIALKADESLWALFPILLGAAAMCLLMFFFISPSFKSAEPVPERSLPLTATDR
jgi:hypothetical protein